MPMQLFAVNLTGPARRDTLDGREQLVVQTAMIAKGVWEGSLGALFYDDPELAESAPTWDHKPLVVYHPKRDGRHVSACDPVVLSSRRVGILLNTRHDGKLRTESWIDVEKCNRVDDRIVPALESGKPVECSTGLTFNAVPGDGEYDGKRYVAKVEKIVGDHLAILPDQPGAYPVSAGGGLLVMNEADFEAYNRQFSDAQRKEMASKGTALPDGSFPIANESDLKNAIRAFGRAKNKAAAKRHIIKRARALGLTSLLPDDWNVAANLYLAANELSFSDIACQLRDALAAKYGQPGKSWYGYVLDVYPTYVIFGGAGDIDGDGDDDSDAYWQIGYSVKDDAVSLTGDAVEVEKVFQPVANAQETPMAFDKKKWIDGLIANGVYAEADRADLEKTPDKVLEAIKVPVKESTTNAATTTTPAMVKTDPPAPAVNQTPKWDEVLANADPVTKEAIIQGRKAVEKQKAGYVTRILANANNKFTKEWLEQQNNMEMLEAMANLAGPTVEEVEMTRQPYYGLAGGYGPGFGTNAADAEEPLLPPADVAPVGK